MDKFKSKRFLSFSVSIVLFVVLLFFTEHAPMELAGAISMIATIYIGAETLRPTQTTVTGDSITQD